MFQLYFYIRVIFARDLYADNFNRRISGINLLRTKNIIYDIVICTYIFCTKFIFKIVV